MKNSKNFLRVRFIIYQTCPFKGQLSLAGYVQSSVPGELSGSKIRVFGRRFEDWGQIVHLLENLGYHKHCWVRDSNLESYLIFSLNWVCILENNFCQHPVKRTLSMSKNGNVFLSLVLIMKIKDPTPVLKWHYFGLMMVKWASYWSKLFPLVAKCRSAKLRSRLVIFLTIYEFGDEIDCGL